MANFNFRLRGFPGGPHGIVFTIPDNAMTRMLNMIRSRRGQVPVDPLLPLGPKRDMTDKEAFYAEMTGFVNGMLAASFSRVKEVAHSASESGLTPDNVTGTTEDNT